MNHDLKTFLWCHLPSRDVRAWCNVHIHILRFLVIINKGLISSYVLLARGLQTNRILFMLCVCVCVSWIRDFRYHRAVEKQLCQSNKTEKFLLERVLITLKLIWWQILFIYKGRRFKVVSLSDPSYWVMGRHCQYELNLQFKCSVWCVVCSTQVTRTSLLIFSGNVSHAREKLTRCIHVRYFPFEKTIILEQIEFAASIENVSTIFKYLHIQLYCKIYIIQTCLLYYVYCGKYHSRFIPEGVAVASKGP
jgi:hypothetical protein